MSEFDKNLKPGDLIFSLQPGVHRVIRVEQRFYKRSYPSHNNQRFVGKEYNSLIHYEQVLTKDMRQSCIKSRNSADVNHCQKIDEELLNKVEDVEINIAKKKKDTIMSLIKESED